MPWIDMKGQRLSFVLGRPDERIESGFKNACAIFRALRKCADALVLHDEGVVLEVLSAPIAFEAALLQPLVELRNQIVA